MNEGKNFNNHTFDDLKSIYYLYIKNEDDRNYIEKAYKFAEKKHAGIFRKSGEPYLQHLIEVAYICCQLNTGPVTIAAAFLHDVVEDTDTSIKDIENEFGSDCAKIVDSVTKIQRLKLSHRSLEEFEAEDHRKIFLGMAKDVRVIIIKLADRLHNMRTISSLSPERQKALGEETLEVFAPIAHRLGIYSVESELEDLSLRVSNPEVYKEIEQILHTKSDEKQKSLNQFKKKLAEIAFNAGINYEIEARIKSVYSIYKKIYIKGRPLDQIYDILALRIITDDVLHCYELLGLIHQFYRPIPGRFKDYIAVPKPNMYQSLHTTLVAGDGNIFEVQIRTKEMDEIAENGVAAHWRYKEGSNYDAKAEQRDIEEKLHWFRDFVSMSNDSEESAQEYLDSLTKDIFDANVYVFTPKGKVIDLPNGSTPLDMAFKIHTKIGEQAVGASINGIMVPLSTKLITGDVVEIKTSKNAPGPNSGWLDIVHTSSAKSKIKKYLLKNGDQFERQELIKKGKELCLLAFEEHNIDEKEMENLINTENVLKNYHCKDLDDLYFNITKKNPTTLALCDFLGLKRIFKQDLALSKKENIKSDCPVYVEGVDDLLINMGRCCQPIPGDEIVGYITKGLGVTVHRKDCPNIKNESRLIDVHWHKNLNDEFYPVDIVVECFDRSNLVTDIMNILTSAKIKITEFNAKYNQNEGTSTISLQIYVSNVGMLEHVISTLKGISSVYSIKRVIH